MLPHPRPSLALRQGGGRWVPFGGQAGEELPGGEELPDAKQGLLFAGTEPLNCCWEPPRRPPASTCGEVDAAPSPLRWWGGLVGPGGGVRVAVGLGSHQLPGRWAYAWGPERQRETAPSLRTCPRGHKRHAETRSRGSAGDPIHHPIMTTSQLCPQPPSPAAGGLVQAEPRS